MRPRSPYRDAYYQNMGRSYPEQGLQRQIENNSGHYYNSYNQYPINTQFPWNSTNYRTDNTNYEDFRPNGFYNGRIPQLSELPIRERDRSSWLRAQNIRGRNSVPNTYCSASRQRCGESNNQLRQVYNRCDTGRSLNRQDKSASKSLIPSSISKSPLVRSRFTQNHSRAINSSCEVLKRHENQNQNTDLQIDVQNIYENKSLVKQKMNNVCENTVQEFNVEDNISVSSADTIEGPNSTNNIIMEQEFAKFVNSKASNYNSNSLPEHYVSISPYVKKCQNKEKNVQQWVSETVSQVSIDVQQTKDTTCCMSTTDQSPPKKLLTRSQVKCQEKELKSGAETVSSKNIKTGSSEILHEAFLLDKEGVGKVSIEKVSGNISHSDTSIDKAYLTKARQAKEINYGKITFKETKRKEASNEVSSQIVKISHKTKVLNRDRDVDNCAPNDIKKPVVISKRRSSLRSKNDDDVKCPKISKKYEENIGNIIIKKKFQCHTPKNNEACQVENNNKGKEKNNTADKIKNNKDCKSPKSMEYIKPKNHAFEENQHLYKIPENKYANRNAKGKSEKHISEKSNLKTRCEIKSKETPSINSKKHEVLNTNINDLIHTIRFSIIDHINDNESASEIVPIQTTSNEELGKIDCGYNLSGNSGSNSDTISNTNLNKNVVTVPKEELGRTNSSNKLSQNSESDLRSILNVNKNVLNVPNEELGRTNSNNNLLGNSESDLRSILNVNKNVLNVPNEELGRTNSSNNLSGNSESDLRSILNVNKNVLNVPNDELGRTNGGNNLSGNYESDLTSNVVVIKNAMTLLKEVRFQSKSVISHTSVFNIESYQKDVDNLNDILIIDNLSNNSLEQVEKLEHHCYEEKLVNYSSADNFEELNRANVTIPTKKQVSTHEEPTGASMIENIAAITGVNNLNKSQMYNIQNPENVSNHPSCRSGQISRILPPHSLNIINLKSGELDGIACNSTTESNYDGLQFSFTADNFNENYNSSEIYSTRHMTSVNMDMISSSENILVNLWRKLNENAHFGYLVVDICKKFEYDYIYQHNISSCETSSMCEIEKHILDLDHDALYKVRESRILRELDIITLELHSDYSMFENIIFTEMVHSKLSTIWTSERQCPSVSAIKELLQILCTKAKNNYSIKTQIYNPTEKEKNAIHRSNVIGGSYTNFDYSDRNGNVDYMSIANADNRIFGEEDGNNATPNIQSAVTVKNVIDDILHQSNGHRVKYDITEQDTASVCSYPNLTSHHENSDLKYETDQLVHDNNPGTSLQMHKDCAQISKARYHKESIDSGYSDEAAAGKTGDDIIYCTVCSKVAELRCSKCKAMCYCSIKCQRKHWDSGHKHSCK